MSMGAERAADAGPEGFGADQQDDWLGRAPEEPEAAADDAPERDSAPMPIGVRLLGGLLILLALGWAGLFGWSLWQSRPALAPGALVAAAATFSAPLILLALLWLW